MIEDLQLTGTLGDYEIDFPDDRPIDFEHGCLKRYEFDAGILAEAQVYFPDNITSDTKVVVFYPGGGGVINFWREGENSLLCIQDYLAQYGSDCIVVMPNTNQGYEITASYSLDMVDMIKQQYGITSSGCGWSGHSMGTAMTLMAASEYIETNPDAEPQICFLFDNYAHNYGGSDYYNNGVSLINSTADSFKQNGTILFDLSWNRPNNLINMYAEAGVNVLKVSYAPGTEMRLDYKNGASFVSVGGDFGFTHQAVYQALFRDQFYEFYAGTGPLPEGFIFEYYDQGSGTWVQIDREEIDTYEKLHAFYGNVVNGTNLYENKINALKSLEDVSLAVTSDSDVLASCINGVIGKIRLSNFVQNSVSFDGGFGGSTTSVPTQIPGVVSSFFDSNANFLTLLASDMNSIAQIGASIDEINNQLAILAGELDPSGTPPVEPGEEPVEPEETPNEEPTEPENQPIVPGETVPEEPETEPPELGEEPVEPEETPNEEPTEPENQPTVPEETVPEEPEADGGIITEEGEVLEEGEDGEYVTEEGGNENPTTMGDTVGGEDGKTPGSNSENEGPGGGNASEPEPDNNGNGDKPENQGEQPENKPNTNGNGGTPNVNPTPNPAPGYRPPSNPTPSPTPNPSPAPSPSQPPQNNPGFGDIPVDGNGMDINPLEQFPEYSEVYSSEDMIVYNFNDEYKIVIHTDGDKIIGIEHYYDFGNEVKADNALNGLMNQYSSNENLENIVQSDRYVKVIFESDVYENMTIEDIRNKYSNLNEVIR